MLGLLVIQYYYYYYVRLREGLPRVFLLGEAPDTSICCPGPY